ncbi:hypothetical protein C355_06778, partial [Cryptococcus neoformans Th84]
FRFGRHALIHSAGQFVWGGGTLRIRASANGSEPPPALWTSARLLWGNRFRAVFSTCKRLDLVRYHLYSFACIQLFLAC